MKVWVYVEGQSDRLGLGALWAKWIHSLDSNQWGLKLIALSTKDKFLRKIGPYAAEKLSNDLHDLVVGLPDFYPNANYAQTPMRHDTVEELQELQRRSVKKALQKTHGIRGNALQQAMNRFWPSALKHDMEMLLLAAKQQLRAVLGTENALGNWRVPVEEQDQNKPPKRIVQQLFITKTARKRAYRETKDAPAVLGRVGQVGQLLRTADGKVNCPVFKNALDWVGEMTKVPAYA